MGDIVVGGVLCIKVPIVNFRGNKSCCQGCYFNKLNKCWLDGDFDCDCGFDVVYKSKTMFERSEKIKKIFND